MIHRDLKPQNVLVDQEDQVYVSDFGLAKSLEVHASMMTSTGEVNGTPRYMSPEQVEAGAVDHRSDLYSLGLILYEMVTADLPFESDSVLQAMYQRVTQSPKSPKTLNPDVPDYLVNIIMRCLEKDPAQRYQHARDILVDLDRAPTQRRRDASVPVPPAATAPRWKRPVVWVTAAAIFARCSYFRWCAEVPAISIWRRCVFHQHRGRSQVCRYPSISRERRRCVAAVYRGWDCRLVVRQTLSIERRAPGISIGGGEG